MEEEEEALVLSLEVVEVEQQALRLSLHYPEEEGLVLLLEEVVVERVEQQPAACFLRVRFRLLLMPTIKTS